MPARLRCGDEANILDHDACQAIELGRALAEDGFQKGTGRLAVVLDSNLGLEATRLEKSTPRDAEGPCR